MLNFTRLQAEMPANSTSWAGFGNPFLINTDNLTGDDNSPDSGALETVAKMLEALYKAQKTLNAERVAQQLPEVAVIQKTSTYDDATEATSFVYTLVIEVDTDQALDNVVDPSVAA